MNIEVGSKRLELLRTMVPTAGVIGVLINPSRPGAADQARVFEEDARVLGLQVQVLSATTEGEIEAAFTRLGAEQSKALLVNTDAFFFSRRAQLVDLAARHAIPAIFDRREYVRAGGLVSYGGSVTDVYRLAGNYAGRILKGETPAKLPVQQSTKIELVINMKAAKALSLTIPPTLLAIADDVIE